MKFRYLRTIDIVKVRNISRLKKATEILNNFCKIICSIASNDGGIVCNYALTQKGIILKEIIIDFFNSLKAQSHPFRQILFI